jgi:hypothetical protein
MTVSAGIYICVICIPGAIEFTTAGLAKKKEREFTTRAAAHRRVANYDDQNMNLTARLFYLCIIFSLHKVRRVYAA